MIEYTYIVLDDTSIYSIDKGNKILRRGDTVQIEYGEDRHGVAVIQVPWTRVREARPNKEAIELFRGKTSPAPYDEPAPTPKTARRRAGPGSGFVE